MPHHFLFNSSPPTMRPPKILNGGPSSRLPSPLSLQQLHQLHIQLYCSILTGLALHTSRLWSPHSSSARRSTTPRSPRSSILITPSYQITTLRLQTVSQLRFSARTGSMMSLRDGAVTPISRSATRRSVATAASTRKQPKTRDPRTRKQMANMKLTKRTKEAKCIWTETSKPFATAVPNAGSGSQASTRPRLWRWGP